MATATAEIVEVPESLYAHIYRPDVVKMFADALGGDKEAMIYIQSVMVLVQSAEPGEEYSLRNCSNRSIVRAALRAVTLRVSVDPAVRQAWLVPRKNKKTGQIEACLQLHYAEVRNRAMRTRLYRHINVGPVYEGETVYENVYTGLHQVQLATGTMTQPTPVDFDDGWVPVGLRKGKIIGWLGYSERTNGTKQTVYMSVQDIETFITGIQEWGLKSFAWKNHRQTMERKTVLLALLRKEDLGAPDGARINQVLEEAEDSGDQDENVVDGELRYEFDEAAQAGPIPAPAVASPVPVSPVTSPAPASTKTPAPLPNVGGPIGTTAYNRPGTEQKITYRKELRYEVAKDYFIGEKRLGDMTIDELEMQAQNPKRASSMLQAIQVVKSHKVDEAMKAEKGVQ